MKLRVDDSRTSAEGRRLLCVFCLCSTPLFAQDSEKGPLYSFVPAPIRFELTQHFNPWDKPNRIGTDRLRLSAAGRSFSVEYSNQAPSVFAGRQFHSIPSGYSLVDVSHRWRWGAVHGFRTTNYSTRAIPRQAARRIAGAALELSKAPAGTRAAAYFVKAGPVRFPLLGKGDLVPPAAQLGFALEREFLKRVRIQSEWTHTELSSRYGKTPEKGSGFYLKLTGKLSGAEYGWNYRAQSQGLRNPAQPVQGRGRMQWSADVGRSFGKLRLQFSNRLDTLEALKALQLPFTSTDQRSLRCTYSPKIPPQLTASRSWTRQLAPGRFEREGSYRIGLNKVLKRLTLGAAYTGAARADDLTLRRLWTKTSFLADAAFNMPDNRFLNLHYETSDFALANVVFSAAVLQMNARFAPWGDKITFHPSFDFRHNSDSLGKTDSRWISILFSSALKLPRRIPGADFLIHLNIRSVADINRLQQTSAGLVFQWTFRRL